MHETDGVGKNTADMSLLCVFREKGCQNVIMMRGRDFGVFGQPAATGTSPAMRIRYFFILRTEISGGHVIDVRNGGSCAFGQPNTACAASSGEAGMFMRV